METGSSQNKEGTEALFWKIIIIFLHTFKLSMDFVCWHLILLYKSDSTSVDEW